MLGLDDLTGSTASKRLLVRFRISLVMNIKNFSRDLKITCWSQKRSQLNSQFPLVSSVEFFQKYGLCYGRRPLMLDISHVGIWEF
jgi:hypothetical protein